MSPEPSLLDTNVLVYALYVDSPHHAAAQNLIGKALHPDAGFCVAPQNLFELFSVITNPRRVTMAFTPDEAVGLIDVLLERPGIVLLPVPPDVVPRCLELLRGKPVSGRRIFDVALAATMLGNGVKRLYTFNESDFRDFNGIEAVTPPTTQQAR